MFTFRPTALSGCYEVIPRVIDDMRGRFVKVFHAGAYAEQGLETHFVEQYYSRSRRGVIRGLHFQLPPRDHAKLVYCTDGAVRDVVVDLRKGSPSYGRHITLELNAETAHAVYIPRGMAHGFCCLSDEATLVYQVSSVHSPEHDSGIRWDSLDIEWPTANPVLSERDRSLPAFADFDSPFFYE